MTLKGHYVLCFKTHAYLRAHLENLNEDRPIVSARLNDSSFRQHKVYMDIRGGFLEMGRQTRVG